MEKKTLLTLKTVISKLGEINPEETVKMLKEIIEHTYGEDEKIPDYFAVIQSGNENYPKEVLNESISLIEDHIREK